MTTTYTNIQLRTQDSNKTHADLNTAHADLNTAHADLNKAHADVSKCCAYLNADKTRIGMRKDGTLVMYSGRFFQFHPDQRLRMHEFIRKLPHSPDPELPVSTSDHRLIDLHTALQTFLNVSVVTWSSSQEQEQAAKAPSKNSLRVTFADKGLNTKGSRGWVLQVGDTVVKSFKVMDESAIAHELAMCNSYNKASQRGLPEARMQGDTLVMPFIAGSTPTKEEVTSAVGKLFRLGFMMADPSPHNFVKNERGDVVPVDFRLLFKTDERGTMCLSIMREIVHDYVKAGYRYVPESLKDDYRAAMNEFDQTLGKDSPLRKIDTKQLQKEYPMAPRPQTTRHTR